MCTISKVLEVLEKAGKLDADTVARTKKFISDNAFPTAAAAPEKRPVEEEPNGAAKKAKKV